jgi:nucleotide-binding universal stress UspA family protein
VRYGAIALLLLAAGVAVAGDAPGAAWASVLFALAVVLLPTVDFTLPTSAERTSMLLDTPRRQSARRTSEPSRGADRRGPLIVAGYDGTPQARDAVTSAAERAGPRGTVLAVHVLPPAPAHLGTPYYERVVEDGQLRGRQLLRELADGLTTAARLETELFHGAPADVLSRVARARGADEIVVGSRGLGRWRSLVGTSVSQRLLRVADRPVLVIPSGAVRADSTPVRPVRVAHAAHERRRPRSRTAAGGRRSRTRESE